MKTILWSMDREEIQEEVIMKAAQVITNGELVAFPTETVYGLGANACDAEAVAKVFEAKGRPIDNPLIVHIANKAMLEKLVIAVPAKAKRLIERFWPGALTIVLHKQEGVFPNAITAGLETVALRMPSHPIALALIRAANVPIAAPSANRSGRPSPTLAQHVLEDLDGKIAGIIDGGRTEVGLESTVIDCTIDPPIILRQGGVTEEQIEACIGSVATENVIDEQHQPRSPGMKYTHYAPKATLHLIAGSPTFIQSKIDEACESGKKVGILTVVEREELYQADVVVASGTETDLATVAGTMYDSLRKFDHTDVDIIFGETFPEAGLGNAIMNRLRKAAGNRMINEN